MADVFVSYVREDSAIAEKLSHGLERAGFSVWWDRHIHGGVNFSNEIQKQLDAAKAVVVLWSNASLESEWVRDEAGQARDEQKLVPVRLDSAQPPLGFRQVQTIDLSAWDGSAKARAFESLLASVRNRTSGGGSPGAVDAVAVRNDDVRRTGRSRNRRWIAVAALASVMVVGAVVTRMRGNSDDAQAANERFDVGPVKLLVDAAETRRFAEGFPATMASELAASGMKTGASGARDADVGNGSAEFIVNALVDRADQTLVVRADVLRRGGDGLLWSTKLRGPVDDIPTLEERVSKVVADAARCSLAIRARIQPSDRPTRDFTGSVFRWCGTATGGTIDENGAILEFGHLPQLARQVAQAVPDSSIGHGVVALSDALCVKFGCVANSSPTDLQRIALSVADDANRAIAKDPNNGGAYVALAVVPDPRRSAAEREQLLLTSIERDPEFYAAHSAYGDLLGGVGRIRDAQAQYEQAINANPSDMRVVSEAAYLRASSGDLVGARRRFAEGLRLYPNSVPIRIWWSIVEGGPGGDAKLAEQLSAKLPPPPLSETECNRKLDEADAERVQITEALVEATCPSQSSTSNFHSEWLYASRGMVDAAFRAFEAHAQGYSIGSTELRQLFLPNIFVELRRDPRFMHFAWRLGLVDYWLDTDLWPDFCSSEKLDYDCKQEAQALRDNAT